MWKESHKRKTRKMLQALVSPVNVTVPATRANYARVHLRCLPSALRMSRKPPLRPLSCVLRVPSASLDLKGGQGYLSLHFNCERNSFSCTFPLNLIVGPIEIREFVWQFCRRIAVLLAIAQMIGSSWAALGICFYWFLCSFGRRREILLPDYVGVAKWGF